MAIKIKTAKDSGTDSREGTILRYLQSKLKSDLPSPISQYIVPLLDLFHVSGPNGKHLCLVFELTGNSLHTIMEWRSDRETFPVKAVKRIAKQVLTGLVYLHGHGVIHGDLQPGNLLLAMKNLNPKLPKWLSERWIH